MKLTIYSLKGIEFEAEVRSFNVKTQSGEITVLDHHRPLITLLERGRAKIGFNNETFQELMISSGFLEMGPNNNLSVLAD
jgi:F0F1-type ATP synthase epsilon subunit